MLELRSAEEGWTNGLGPGDKPFWMCSWEELLVKGTVSNPFSSLLVNAQLLKILEIVRLLEDIPLEQPVIGQVGTIVEFLGPNVFDVEFCDQAGRVITTLELRDDQIEVKSNC